MSTQPLLCPRHNTETHPKTSPGKTSQEATRIKCGVLCDRGRGHLKGTPNQQERRIMLRLDNQQSLGRSKSHGYLVEETATGCKDFQKAFLSREAAPDEGLKDKQEFGQGKRKGKIL